MADNTLKFRAVMDDKVSGPLDRIRGRFDTLGTSKGFKSFTMGIGLGVGAAAFNLLGQAASGAADFIGDAVKAAIADEASQQKLTSSLKANITAWDGNAAAIEKVLKARMRLGFSDDEQRDSLATLVAATHDVDQALAIQNTAMDLARFKGISLGDATEALTKVEAGSYRILKSLGIVLKDGATAQDALNAVQKVATGQAEDYAQTTGGKVLVAQVKMNEAMEQLGYKLLPLVATAADVASGAIDGLTLAMGDSGTETKAATQGLIDYIPVISQAKYIWENSPKALGDVQDALADVTGATKDQQDAQRDLIESDKIAGVSVDTLARKTDGLAKKSRDSSRIVQNAFADMADSLATDAQKSIDEFFDPLAEKEDILAARAAIAADKAILAKKHTAVQYRDARKDIEESLQKEGDALAKLGAKGKLSSKAVDLYKTDVTAAYKALGKAVPPELQKIIDKLRTLAAIKGAAVSVKVIGGVAQDFSSLTKGKRAGGGPVDPWGAYTVGEKGPETLVMGRQGGTIVPNGGGRAETRIIQLVVSGRVLAQVIDKENGYRLDQAPPTRGG